MAEFKHPYQSKRSGGVYDEGHGESLTGEGSSKVSKRPEILERTKNAVKNIDGVLSDNDSAMKEVAEAEKSGRTLAPEQKSTKLEKAKVEESLGDGSESSFFNDNVDKKQGYKARISFRKAAVAGGSFSTIVIILAVLGISIPTMEAVHLGQVLGSNNSDNEENTSLRIKSLYRYARSGGNAGETRVDAWGSKTANKAIVKLNKMGFEINTGKTFGNFRSLTLDLDKHPTYSKMTQSEALAAVERDFGVVPKQISNVAGKNGRIAMTNSGLSTSASRGLIKTALGQLNDGKILTAMRSRTLGKFLGLPNMFHPIEKLKSKAESAFDKRSAPKSFAEERKKLTEARKNARKLTDSPEVNSAKSALKENPVKKTLGRALIVTAAVCFVYQNADNIVVLNRARIVLPAVVEAVDKTSIASQIMAGEDVDLTQIGAEMLAMRGDDGESIWSGQALQATTGAKNPKGKDITDINKQAFTSESTAAKLKRGANFVLGGQGDNACSPGAQLVQLAGGILLAYYSGGTSTAIGGALTKFALQTALVAATAHVAGELLEDLLKEQPFFKVPPQGALGGNMLAYGAREASNMNGRAGGGVILSEGETAQIDKEIQLRQKKDFQSRSFASRVFDVNDYRSLASMSMRKASYSPARNISNMLVSFGNTGNLFSNLSAVFTGSAGALDESEVNYEWHMPRVAIPKVVRDDPDLQDPYENSAIVAELLNSPSGGNYIDKAKKCFGASITKGPQGWQSVAENDVNPASTAYTDANCDEDSKEWHRIMVFVDDSHIAAAEACYSANGGKDESICAEFGLSKKEHNSSAASSGGSIVAGDNKKLSQEILDNPNISTDEKAEKQLQSMAGGSGPCPETASGSLTIDPMLLGVIASLGKDHKFTIASLHRGCYGSTAGAGKASRHWKGKAVDISGSRGIDGATLPSYSTNNEAIQKFINDAAQLLPDGCELGVPNDTYKNNVLASSPKCNNVFLDTPGTTGATAPHVHLGVPL